MCVLTLYLKVRLLRGFIASSYAFQLQIVGIARSTRRVHLSVQPYLSKVFLRTSFCRLTSHVVMGMDVFYHHWKSLQLLDYFGTDMTRSSLLKF